LIDTFGAHRMERPRRRAYRPRLESLDVRCLPSGLTPSQVSGAYGLNAVNFQVNNQTTRGDGTGQTIAIVDAYHDPNLASDLATFDQTYGLPAAQVSQVYASGTPTDSGWSGEEALDVEWAHAMAPNAKIVVVEARSSSLTDLMSAVDTARNTAGVSVVSMSWGTGEFAGETAYDSHFTTPSGHTPITFVASTGDSGAGAGAQWPAVSPNVVAVGGTSLNLNASGGYGGESAWSGGGGGVSALETRPSYQAGVASGSTRSTPDVAAVADPNTGLSVYSGGTWMVVGGTSASAPIWAGILAVADQGRALAGRSTLDGATQTLPAIYSAPAGAFHDVTAGSNGYGAGVGYDLATGRGTPNGPALIAYLSGTTVTGAGATTTGTTTSGTTTTTTTGTGTTGTGTTTTTTGTGTTGTGTTGTGTTGTGTAGTGTTGHGWHGAGWGWGWGWWSRYFDSPSSWEVVPIGSGGWLAFNFDAATDTLTIVVGEGDGTSAATSTTAPGAVVALDIGADSTGLLTSSTSHHALDAAILALY
jgi:subtilase family serine protease